MAKIMVVDDSPAVREQVRSDLVGEGYEVVEAGDGRSALEWILANGPVQLIICDLNMPRLDGFGLCEELKRQEKTAQIPVFMLTSQSDNSLKQKGKELGIKAWIIKPYAVQALRSGVKCFAPK